MLPRPLHIVLAALATSFATVACAQAPSTPVTAAPPAATRPSNAPVAPLVDPQLARIEAAIQAAERGSFDASEYRDLGGHPLYGWVEYASLRHTIDSVTAPRANAFLQRYDGQVVADAFRESWLAETARREDWNAFLAAWAPTESSTLRCAHLRARDATGRADAQWVSDAQAIWLRGGKSLPNSCDAVFATLEAKGALTPALRWERIEKAAAAGEPAVMRSAARGLPADEHALALDYAAFIDGVHTRALQWPKSARSRLIASHGLARLAKTHPDAAEVQLPLYADALDFSEAERGRVLYPIALWTVASYLPESARRLNAVPASAYDERLHEWRVREAMARSDWRAALAAIRQMGPTQRGDSRWEYFEARLAELTGDKAAAQAKYQLAAREPEFHGFLAADRIDQPYALCPWLPYDSAVAKTAVARDPAIVRAIGLYRLDRNGWALREWNDALARFDDSQRRVAVEVAQANGWFDRAVFSLGKNPSGSAKPDELRPYTLRFPLHHDATIRREAA